MEQNAPENYVCPICLGVTGVESEDTLLKQADLVFRDELVSVWINSFWIKGNEGHLIIVPNQHFENIYDLPDAIGHRIFDVARHMSTVMKRACACDGVTLRQNNESAGDQHAFHYHLHIFPRYTRDTFNLELTKKVSCQIHKQELYTKKNCNIILVSYNPTQRSTVFTKIPN